MSDPQQPEDDTGGGGPREESDATSEADAGLTGDEGVGTAQPAIAHDDDPDDD
ncbi:MAG: hypothetical protein KY460_01020 [Actinobacteria bacterium]|nr:hypothetical protein [Actinomycetota bacterium]